VGRVGVGVVVEAVALDPAGHVHVGDPLQGQGVQEGERVAAVVAGVGVQVGHVQQQPGAGPLQQLGVRKAASSSSGAGHSSRAATCSLTSGAASRSASPARRATRAGSGSSADPSDSLTPCGTTGTPRASSAASPSGRGCPSWMLSATTTSANPSPSRRAANPASSGRQPIPTPARGEEGAGEGGVGERVSPGRGLIRRTPRRSRPHNHRHRRSHCLRRRRRRRRRRR